MTQTKEDLKQRRKSYGQYKREQILKPKLQRKTERNSEKVHSKFKAIRTFWKHYIVKKLEDGWTDLKREARKRGIL